MTTKQADQIIAKLDQIINLLQPKTKNRPQTNSEQLKNKGLVNSLMEICTHPGYDDKQYCSALKQLKDLDFALSPKQMAWILCYTLRHATCGDSISSFIQSEIDRVEDKKKFVDTICFELRKNYSNEKNAEYLEGVVEHLKKLV